MAASVSAAAKNLARCVPVSHNKFVLPQRSATCTGTPFSVYTGLLQNKILKEDQAQKRTLEELTNIFHDIKDNKAEKRGMYIHGPPGSGKSMAMDLFHHCIVSATELSGVKTKRQHFHEFMHDIHRRMHQLYSQPSKSSSDHVVKTVAKAVSSEVDVLCFDEMNVTTVQDCAILLPLFQHLFQNGVVCVMTSNRRPEDLYTDGLNRHIFLPPLLEKLRGFCRVIAVESGCDYRALKMEEDVSSGLQADKVFHWPSQDGGDAFVDEWINKLSNGKAPEKRTVDIAYGRTMDVNVINDTVGVFDFDVLCGKERATKHYSADDYFALTNKFPVFIVRNVPQFQVDNHNEARRWTNFIDACYENQCRLILTLHGSPENIMKQLMPLTAMTMDKVGAGYIGSSDFDACNSSSGVLAAVDSIKATIRQEEQLHGSPPESQPRIEVPEPLKELDISNFDPAKDQEIWRQRPTRRHPNPLPQVTRSWDRRRRSTGFAWEGADPTAEQETVKGVFKAAVASLQESGFAALRMTSRLQEMQTREYQVGWKIKWNSMI